MFKRWFLLKQVIKLRIISFYPLLKFLKLGATILRITSIKFLFLQTTTIYMALLIKKVLVLNKFIMHKSYFNIIFELIINKTKN